MIFPPVRIEGEYFGDGAMRQATPLSPAVHLGADRILVIGVRDERVDAAPDPIPGERDDYPGAWLSDGESLVVVSERNGRLGTSRLDLSNPARRPPPKSGPPPGPGPVIDV